MASRLESSTDSAVHSAWAERLGVTSTFLRASRPIFIDRSDLTAVVVVQLDQTVAVAAPERALARLRSLESGQLLHVGSLLRALEPLVPRLIGVASLAVADRRTIAPVASHVARIASKADVDAVLTQCSVEERDESGLLEMGARWVALGEDGEPAGAAGYEVWGGGLAHIGVAVSAASRGKGLGACAATAAALHGIGLGLVPQWRCRRDNHASARMAARLGFVPIGAQIAIDLAPDEPASRH